MAQKRQRQRMIGGADSHAAQLAAARRERTAIARKADVGKHLAIARAEVLAHVRSQKSKARKP